MNVLCTGDLHIGRRPTRLPPHVDGRPLASAQAWQALVDYALDQRVDLVALSGDVVDRANRYFEAIGPLERGLRRLAAAGIATVAVAGNHDHDVLPQLARTVGSDAFRLLGRGGTWERTSIQARGGERLHVDGWSFPAEHVRDDPLAGYALPPDPGVPTLGLLHADLDAPGSHYAPVSLRDLRSHPIAFWLLGHVHGPALHAGDGAAPVLYPGSPQPLHPGEPGVHGAWLLDLRAGCAPTVRQIPLATVRYETVDIDVSDVTDAAELRQVVVERARREIGARLRDAGPLRYLSARLRIVGRTPVHRHVARELAAMAEDWEHEEGGVTAFVERVDVETRAARDLAALAGGSDAAAVLAR
ncbi:MAG TPA: DNA repair exonuclease, partial [Gemmatimonadaceae bacterium]|nr:DNA repair exonuclease [Gemmatimonadaceae bacterium]